MKRLVEQAPDLGRVIREGGEVMVPALEIAPGDVVRILPGEVSPVDGVIIDGTSSFDQSVMTGESLPARKTGAASAPTPPERTWRTRKKSRFRKFGQRFACIGQNKSGAFR